MWDGLCWKDLPQTTQTQPKSIGYVNSLIANGTKIYVGGAHNEHNSHLPGQFRQFEGNLGVNNIMSYDFETGVVDSMKSGVAGVVNVIKVWKDSIFIGGNFDTLFASDTLLYNIAQYNITTQTWTGAFAVSTYLKIDFCRTWNFV